MMKHHMDRPFATLRLRASLLVSLASTFAFSAIVSCDTESQAGKRNTISLDGTWQVAEGTMDQMPRAFEHTVPVPGLLIVIV